MIVLGENIAFFGVAHLVALGVIVGLVVVAVRVMRRVGATGEERMRRGVAVGLLGVQAVWHARAVWEGDWRLEKYLPLQLCDAAVVVGILALWRPGPRLFELCYFWGFGGAVQALLTPEIGATFPEYLYWSYFLTHGGLVIAPAMLAFGLDLRLRKGAILRTLAMTNALAVMAGLANWITGGNYMYLRNPPEAGSLLDFFGPWPWYIVASEGVAVVLFLVLGLLVRSNREGCPEPSAPGR